MKYAKKFVKHPRQLQLDLTVTMPGLFDLENMWHLHKDLQVPLLCKKVFTFSPDVFMSPLFLPKELLHPMVEEVQNKLEIDKQKKSFINLAFIDGLEDLKNHPTNEEKYDKETYVQGLKDGKAECERIDKIRGNDIKTILAKNPKVLEWWNDI